MPSTTGLPIHRLYDLRKQLGLSQAKFAESLSVDNHTFSADTISKIERYERPISVDLAVCVRKVYNKSIDWLFCQDENTISTATPGELALALRNAFRLTTAAIEYGDQKLTCFSISMEEPLHALIDTLSLAETFRDNHNLPDNAYNLWIEDAKTTYTKSVESADTIPHKEYLVIPREYLSDKTLTTLIEDLQQNAPLALSDII